MKYLVTTLVLALAPLACSQSANEFFKKGEAALKRGDANAAKAAYLNALKVDPDHGNSRLRLASMKQLTAQASVTARKVKMEKIILPTINLEDASLEESLEILQAMIEKEDESFTANFVITDPSGDIRDRTVNLRLRNIPATAALKYILSQANAKATWDAHAINVYPVGGAKKATPKKEAKVEAKAADE